MCVCVFEDILALHHNFKGLVEGEGLMLRSRLSESQDASWDGSVRGWERWDILHKDRSTRTCVGVCFI